MRLKQPVVGSGFGVGSGKYSLKILAGGYCRFCHREAQVSVVQKSPALGPRGLGWDSGSSMSYVTLGKCHVLLILSSSSSFISLGPVSRTRGMEWEGGCSQSGLEAKQEQSH